MATALYLGGEEKRTESCRLSYCTGVITAAISAHLFNNVNLATAWYYNILSHTEVALVPSHQNPFAFSLEGLGLGSW